MSVQQVSSVFGQVGTNWRERYYWYLTADSDGSAKSDASAWLEKFLAPEGEGALGWKRQPENVRFMDEYSDVKQTPPDHVLVYHAPLALIEGAWLQNVNRPAASHFPSVCLTFRAYLGLLGQDAGQSPAHAYRGLLASRGLQLPLAKSAGFANHPGMGTTAFAWGALNLAFGLVGYDRWDELLGYSLAYGDSQSAWRLAGLTGPQRMNRLSCYRQHIGRACDIHLASLGEQQAKRTAERRIGKGYDLYVRAEREYLAELGGVEDPDRSLTERVARIFESKSVVAAGYHRDKTLGHRSLDRWFSEQPFDAQGFLRAFAACPWAKRANGIKPFDHLTRFGGPMFGVFSEEELRTIDQWLTSEIGSECITPVVRAPAAPVLRKPRISTEFAAVYSRRELFHRLVNDVNDEETSACAERLIEKELSRASRSLSPRGPLARRFFEYSPSSLEAWVQQLHGWEVGRGRTFIPPPKLTREEYRWGILQFAPAVLVDGCWLAGTGFAVDQDDPVKRRLLNIYADELGAGDSNRHHPAIYRRLMTDLSIELPRLESIDFAYSPRLLDASFDLPVFCLAIGTHVGDRLPEILGLNLAIELSGLGSQYQRLADELAYWGIDPLIVRLHQSIDNLASGHSALAVEAIRTYLEEVASRMGVRALDDAWRRIWTGYLSLNTVTKRFRRSLALEFVRVFGPARVRAMASRKWHELRIRTATL